MKTFIKKTGWILCCGLLAANSLYGQQLLNHVLPEDHYPDLTDEARARFVELNQLLERGEEPNFEAVARIFPHFMDYPKALVGIKEHHGRFLSSWDGAIIFPPFYVSFELENAEPFTRAGNRGRKFMNPTPFESPEVEKLGNELLDGYLPVITRRFAHDSLLVEQTLFGYADDFLTESPLIAFVRMKVKNLRSTKVDKILSVHFRGTGARPYSQIWATNGSEVVRNPMELSAQGNKIFNENGDVVFWSNSDEGAFGNDKMNYTFVLGAGEETEYYFCLPFEPLAQNKVNDVSKSVHDAAFEPVAQNQVTDLSKAAYDEATAQVKAYWEGIVNRGMQINVPEQIVNEAYKTWHFNNFLLVQEDISRRTYKTTDAPFFYEGIFGYAAAMYLNTITSSGYFEEAKKCADMFLDLQWADGSISGVNRSNGVIPHQHGAVLHTISQIYRKERDKDWFGLVIPDLIRGCNWIINQRAKTMTGNRQAVTYGMLPAHRSNVDTGPGTQEYLGNAWCWAGLNEVATALREFGGEYANESKRLQREADAYRSDLIASMDRATLVEDGLTFLPMDVKETTPYPYLVENSKAFYYSILSSRMLEAQIFDADDKRLTYIPDFLEARKGIILGVTRFGGSNKLGYTAHFAAGYGITNLRLGRIDRSLLNFYGMLAYGMDRDLYATQEHDNFVDGKNDGWYYARQPHLHSTSELIRITNEMLLHEERNTIWLSRGVPRKWLEDGKVIEVKNAQTCFGAYSYRIESRAASGTINAEITATASPVHAAGIELSLRHPEGKPIKRVEVNGRAWKDFDGDVVRLNGDKRNLSIVAHF